MAEKYVKEENGKEVVYERDETFLGSFFCGDRKIGEVRDSEKFFDPPGTREIVDTSGFFEKVVGRMDKEDFYGDTKATIEGETGTINTKNPWSTYHEIDDKPIFKPEEVRTGRLGTSSRNRSSVRQGGRNSSSSSGGGLGILLGLSLLGGVICAIGDRPQNNSVSGNSGGVAYVEHSTLQDRVSYTEPTYNHQVKPGDISFNNEIKIQKYTIPEGANFQISSLPKSYRNRNMKAYVGNVSFMQTPDFRKNQENKQVNYKIPD